MTIPPFLWSSVFITFHKKHYYKNAELKIVHYFPKIEMIAGAITSVAVQYFSSDGKYCTAHLVTQQKYF